MLQHHRGYDHQRRACAGHEDATLRPLTAQLKDAGIPVHGSSLEPAVTAPGGWPANTAFLALRTDRMRVSYNFRRATRTSMLGLWWWLDHRGRRLLPPPPLDGGRATAAYYDTPPGGGRGGGHTYIHPTWPMYLPPSPGGGGVRWRQYRTDRQADIRAGGRPQHARPAHHTVLPGTFQAHGMRRPLRYA